MQFQVPANLQAEIINYDPDTKKQQALKRASATPGAKPRASLGMPVDMIPANIIPPERVKYAMESINQRPAAERYIQFIKENKVYAIIYHYEKAWYAAWLPSLDQADNYIYGYSYAFKDLDSVRSSVPQSLRYFEHEDIIKYGRANFVVKKFVITKQDILNAKKPATEEYANYDKLYNWNIPKVGSYSVKGREIYKSINEFKNSVSSTIPIWGENSRHNQVFDRLINSNISNYIVGSNGSYLYRVKDDYWLSHDESTFVLDYASFIELIKFHKNECTEERMYGIKLYECLNSIIYVLKTPFFRKWITEKLETFNQKFYDLKNKDVSCITDGWTRFIDTLMRIATINAIWPDTPVDYFRTNISQLEAVRIKLVHHNHDKTIAWLNKHMPVSSFFLALDKFYQDNRTGTERTVAFSNWNDSLDMIDTVLKAGAELAPPRRWRMAEFHDHVMAESWKIKNENAELPQDLFPQPIKVIISETKWTFIQPIDTHQLASWGKAVRNCIGNASAYAEGVKGKKHFIVLCMSDNNPRFTVLLKVNGGIMTVDQIVGFANQSLSSDDKCEYTEAFSKALEIRNQQLEQL